MSRRDDVKEALEDMVRDLPGPNKNNTDNALWEAFIWQTICSVADDYLKQTWEELANSGVTESEAEMRSKSPGEWCAAQGKVLQMMAKLSKPQNSFDKELCMQNIVKAFKLKKSEVVKLSAIFEGSKSQKGSGRLERKITELIGAEIK